jgi:hypothetical protein
VVFRYYECEYFNEDVRVIRERCPILSLNHKITNTLNDLFGDLWKEPFRQWINKTLDLKVKTIE